MVTALVCNTGLDAFLAATSSINAKKIFKPSPDAYSFIEPSLKVKPADVLFVWSNLWDAIGAKAVELKVAWIERATPKAIRSSEMQATDRQLREV